MSYDYDYLIIDWEEGSFTIIVGMNHYDYEIASEGDLLYGGLENGVPFEEQEAGLPEPDEWNEEEEEDNREDEW